MVASGPSVPVAMALYNAVANLGGLLGPWLIGELVARTGGKRHGRRGEGDKLPDLRLRLAKQPAADNTGLLQPRVETSTHPQPQPQPHGRARPTTDAAAPVHPGAP